MLGPLSSIISKIQWKSHHLDKATGPDPSDHHKSAEADNVKIRGGASTDDATKKEGGGSHYESPFRSDCEEIISEALFDSHCSDDAPKKNERADKSNTDPEAEKDHIPLPDSEKITNLDKIFKKTNNVIKKIKGGNGYKGNLKKIKTNPNNKGNLIDRKTG